MGLDTTIESLKPMIRKAQARRRRILKSGLRSQALDLAMAALHRSGFWFGVPPKDTSYPKLLQYKLILKRFLESETSTVGGIKNAEKKKREGFKKFLRSKNYDGDTDIIYNKLGGIDVNRLIEMSGLSCDTFFTDMVISAEDGQLDRFIEDMIQLAEDREYLENLDISEEW